MGGASVSLNGTWYPQDKCVLDEKTGKWSLKEVAAPAKAPKVSSAKPKKTIVAPKAKKTRKKKTK